MYIHTCRYIERQRILLVQALSRKIRPGTNLMTKVFQILTRNLSENPHFFKIDFFSLGTWRKTKDLQPFPNFI